MKATKERESKTGESKRPRGGRTAVRLAEDHDSRPRPLGASRAPSSRKPRRGEEVRERILSAALECFGAFGFEGTSTRAVAERADVTHTLVLYHFQSKDQLWIATMESAIGKYTAVVRANLEDHAERSAKESLMVFIEQFVRMSARTPQIHRILTTEGNQGTDRLEWIIENLLRWHFTAIRDLIRRGQMEGTVREGDPARL